MSDLALTSFAPFAIFFALGLIGSRPLVEFPHREARPPSTQCTPAVSSLPRSLFRSGRGEGAMKMSGAGAVARLSSIFGDRFGSRAAGLVEGTGLVLPNWVPVHS